MNTSRSLRRLAALLGAAALLFAGCTADTSSDKYFQYGAATPVGKVIPKAQRKPVFDIDGRLVSGDAKASLAAHKGTVSVVPYWASWCAPCRVEMPLLQNVHGHYGSKVAFLGVNFKDDRDSARTFLTANRITFPSVFDQPGRNVLKLGNSPSGPPFTMLVDKSGKVAAFYIGRYAEADLTRALDALRAES